MPNTVVLNRMLGYADRIEAACVANPSMRLLLLVIAATPELNLADPRIAYVRNLLVPSGLFSAEEFDGWFSPV